MARLAIARGEHIERIYRESHGIWGGGLTLDDYLGLWRDLAATPWARRFVSFLIWEGDDGELLSSFKLYRPRFRLFGETSRACVIGAVFTPRAHRRRGFADAMIRSALELSRRRGDGPALLFSDIGTRYYGAMGFVPLPSEEVWGRLGRHGRPAPADWRLRPASGEDLREIGRMHDAWCAGRPIAFQRDEGHWEFLLLRTRLFFERLGDARLRPRFRVALAGGRIRGYLVTVEGQGECSLREVGAEGGDAAVMAEVVRLGLAGARSRGLRRAYGWLPPEVTDQLRDWRLNRRPRERAIPMILPLDDRTELSGLDTVESAFIPYQDQF